MAEYEVVFVVITDAPDEDEAIQDAKQLISQRSFEPDKVTRMG